MMQTQRVKFAGNQNIRSPRVIGERYVKSMGKSWLSPNENTLKRVEITDLPILITADGTIVCIPRQPELGVTAWIGMPGRGKTLGAGYMLSNLFYNWNDNLAIINDSQEETFDWSEPCEYSEFVKKILQVHQRPMPLPMIYLFPNMYDLKDKGEQLKEKNYVFVSLPFREIIRNVEKIVPLGNSEKYLLMKRDELLQAKSEQEVIDIIQSINTGEKGQAEVTRKIEASFRALIDKGILNISDPTAPAYLNVGEYIGNPFTAVMQAECIPAFVTSDLYTQKYRDVIFSYYIDCLFDESLKGSMKGKRVWLYFDELTRVVSSDARFSCPETERALNQVVSRGRNNGISLVYATQRYKEIPKTIRELTKYAIVFRHNSKEEAKEIFDDFGVDKMYRQEVLGLKKFEAIAFTNEYFVCYKKNRVWQETSPIRGFVIPALHKNRFLQKDMKGGKK